MRELALVGAGRVGSAFLRFWNDKTTIIVDPHVLMEDYPGYTLIDDIEFGMAKTAIVATPGAIAPQKIIQCFEAGMNVVDASFHNGDNEELGKIAEENGCWYIPDAGFGPGILNMMVKRISIDVPDADTIDAYVGGVPAIQKEPWFYKSTWNAADHLAEYTRPARYIRDGKVEVVMPLESDIRLVNTSIGNMEAFCSDGLRTLLSLPIVPNMTEFTLRWPGFIKNMQLMYKSGLLNPGIIGTFARAIEISKAWEFEPDEQDISILFVEAYSKHGRYGMRMIHRRHPHFEHSSMSWCTAVGMGAVLYMALEANQIKSGVHYIEDMVTNDEQYVNYMKMLEQGGLEINEY